MEELNVQSKVSFEPRIMTIEIANDYKKVFGELGYSPSARFMKEQEKELYEKIRKTWGTFTKFKTTQEKKKSEIDQTPEEYQTPTKQTRKTIKEALIALVEESPKGLLQCELYKKAKENKIQENIYSTRTNRTEKKGNETWSSLLREAVKEERIRRKQDGNSGNTYRYLSKNAQEDNSLSTSDERILAIHKDYCALGTSKKVAEKHGITYQRVQQLLSKGNTRKLFIYPAVCALTQEQQNQVDKAIETGVGLRKIAREQKVTNKMLKNHLEERKINEDVLIENKRSKQKKQLKTEYDGIVKKIGYEPSTTVLQKDKEARLIYIKICRNWESFRNFRKEFGIKAEPKTILKAA